MPMIPVYQTIVDPECGDCERACVATITGIPISEIPNFAAPEVRTQFNLWMTEWLPTRGWGVIEPQSGLGPKDYTYLGLKGLAAIASVPSQRFPGGRHAVVIGWRQHPMHEGAFEPFVFHDPNPGNVPYENVADIATRLRWIVPIMF